MEYEAALERRRKEVEAERLQREQEQARLLEAITSQRSDASGNCLLVSVLRMACLRVSLELVMNRDCIGAQSLSYVCMCTHVLKDHKEAKISSALQTRNEQLRWRRRRAGRATTRPARRPQRPGR